MGMGAMRKREGFTLIEMLIVVSLIALLTLGIVNASESAVRSSNISAMLKTEDLIVEQVKRYYDMEGRVPQTADEFEAFLSDIRYFPSYPETVLCNRWSWKPTSSISGILKPILVDDNDIILQSYDQYQRTIDMTEFYQGWQYNPSGFDYMGDG